MHDFLDAMDSSGVRDMGQQYIQNELGRRGSATFGTGPDPAFAYAEHLASRSASLSREPDRFSLRPTATAAAGFTAQRPGRHPEPADANSPYQPNTGPTARPRCRRWTVVPVGTSVVPTWDGGSEELNGQNFEDQGDYATLPSGFPAGSRHTAENNQKESAMTDHAQCRPVVAWAESPCAARPIRACRRWTRSSMPTSRLARHAVAARRRLPLTRDPNAINRTIQEAEQR